MTKEELENRKLERRAKEWLIKDKGGSIIQSLVNLIKEFTEPREKRIEELEDKLANADYQLEGRDNEIAKLEAQIEKMKNWCNCKNYQQCLIELAEQGKGMKPSECCVNCKKWEIKEND